MALSSAGESRLNGFLIGLSTVAWPSLLLAMPGFALFWRIHARWSHAEPA